MWSAVETAGPESSGSPLGQLQLVGIPGWSSDNKLFVFKTIKSIQEAWRGDGDEGRRAPRRWGR